jgi:hypothetical protein
MPRQANFAAVYGWEALGRAEGASPPEMDLPDHPDAGHEYVEAVQTPDLASTSRVPLPRRGAGAAGADLYW